MRCETFQRRYDALDNGEEPGYFLRAHLASCQECSSRERALERGLGAWRVTPLDARAEALSELVDERIMSAVRILPRPRRELRAGNWVVAGTGFLLSLAFIPFSRDFQVLRELFGVSYTLPLFLVLGLGWTLFGGVFIATHLDELEPYVRRYLNHAPRA